ncbi:acyl-CoA dehydrogenase family protein [Mycolicibacterium arenosum]|uniref:Acyl-CoA/acyl-ACP dehydrogenase n=1 Tax=Mycolicibacterium arenosum TaxID=2952157 RepID=A0ABT1MGH3_9MYCO|nr:acyl-CoA dehydrogenase family protein [Mycolicibacterium sp. CAU 1645]MCP9276852.1 acyl-CoA/acyl-ACP dehydrogenase [Mycolicibacterium sp. CAU 1645]
MDFTFTDDQQTLAEVARGLFERHATPERLTELEAGDVRYDAALWKDLASADLLGIALPESVGGSGGGFLELGLLLAEVGWSVAPVPVYATLLLGADAITRHGTTEQQVRYLTDVTTGDRLLTAALSEPGRSNPTVPVSIARRDGSGWRIDGVKDLVPAARIADTAVVSARTDDGPGLFLVDLHARGVEVRPAPVTGGEPHADIEFDGATAADRIEGDGAGMLTALHERALVGVCALQLGVAERALRIAAAYTTGREQFGRPIGSFQAVQQRMADAFIDVEAIRWTTWHAAWLLSEGRSADRAAHIAKFWAAEAGQRVVATAQQVHGGIGIDVSYPLFRYFLAAKHNELAFGSASAHLAALAHSYPSGEGDRP